MSYFIAETDFELGDYEIDRYCPIEVLSKGGCLYDNRIFINSQPPKSMVREIPESLYTSACRASSRGGLTRCKLKYTNLVG